MISVRTALDLVLRDLPLLGTEAIGLSAARGRVLAERVRADRDVPPFRNSAMDGYAVRAADVAKVPATLRVREVIPAGSLPLHVVEPGTAAKIMTGSVMPDGADAVVRIEDTVESGDCVEVRVGVAGGANVRHPGEDLRAGDVVLEPGRELRPADLGLLASLGHAIVAVRRQPQVAILATGNELVELGQVPAPGQIVNSNAYTLAAAVEESGGLARVLRIAPDTEEDTRAAFEEALDADMVLSTGGVSMGAFDLVRSILASLGVEERFWKVAQKPGKPLTFGMRGRIPVFGLPGNPVSALVCFYVYARPALRAMFGLADVHLPAVPATVDENVRASKGLTDFVRCHLSHDGAGYRARTTGTQSSGVLRSLSLGTGLLVVPPEIAAAEAGSTLRVIQLTAGDTAEPPVPADAHAAGAPGGDR